MRYGRGLTERSRLIGEWLEVDQELILTNAKNSAYRVSRLMQPVLINIARLVAAQTHLSHGLRNDLIGRPVAGFAHEKLIDLVS